MTERKVEVKTYRVHKDCSCGKGEMRSTGQGTVTLHTLWKHRCTACDKDEWFDNISYPYLSHEEQPTNKSETDGFKVSDYLKDESKGFL